MKIAIKNESIVLLEHFFVSVAIFLSVFYAFPTPLHSLCGIRVMRVRTIN